MAISVDTYLEKFRSLFLNRFITEEGGSDHLGLDIGTYSVKMAKVSVHRDKVVLTNCGMSMIRNNDVASAIRDVMASSNINTKIVNIGLSGQGVVLRDISFPKMPLNELKQSIGTEADKYIPFPIEDVLLDCCILKELTEVNKMFVLIAAARKNIIQDKLKLLTELNLEPHLIDINSIALVNGFNELRSKTESQEQTQQDAKAQATGMLNIGASISCLNVLEDSLLKLSRYIYIGGNEYTKKIAYALNSDFESAEKTKCNPSEEEWSKNLESCDLLLNNLIHELRISFDYYETENNMSIGKLYLSGGGAYLKGLKDALSNNLGIEIEIWDPIPHLEVDSSLDITNLKPHFSKLAVAVGLALR